MKPEGEVEAGAVRAAGDEYGVEDPEPAGDLDRPSQKHVRDDAGRWPFILCSDIL